MKDNFEERIKQSSDKDLERIVKDYVFYSEEERFLALNELENRNSLTKELKEYKEKVEDFKKMEEEENTPRHTITYKDLFPQKGYLFTPLLIYLNIFVFLLMILSGTNLFEPQIDTLVQWGGNIRFLTKNGQIWRLFTSLFLHAGILHLVFNMYALLYVGSVLERVVGKNKFISAYLISGIVASVVSLITHENIVSVGASGAIFGLFGVLLALLIFKEFRFADISARNLLLNISFFVVYNIIYGFSNAGIDNSAHIGGLFGGFIIGVVYCLIAKEKIKPLLAYSLMIVLVSSAVFSVFNVSDKFGDYDKAIKEFSFNEQKALWMYRENYATLPTKERLTNEGVDLWERNITLLKEVKKNNYEKRIDKQLDMLIDYSVLRKQACELMIELLEKDSSENESKLVGINMQIENKLKELEEYNKNYR
jgi:Uncharacterized membrane protein (homolog of Drosophila rhomboid)